MELGKKLLKARQEAGLSQRQLCGDVITRNMLSQIEHGTARPSMETLRYLAARLEKPISFFLDEDVVTSPNQALMTQAREKCASEEMEDAWVLLKAFQLPDPMLEWEWRYLSFVTTLAAAQQARKDGKLLYARQLLEEAAEFESGISGRKRQRLLHLGKLPGADLSEIIKGLPSLDEELLLRAEAALDQGNAIRAGELLGAAEDRDDPKWNLLYGRALLASRQYALAAAHLETGEAAYPQICWPLLETCYRELGDFKRAYEYACKRR